MRLTEEEAKEKMCPMARHETQDDNCAGSKCMAWRWVHNVIHKEVGYCGLAGTSESGSITQQRVYHSKP